MDVLGEVDTDANVAKNMLKFFFSPYPYFWANRETHWSHSLAELDENIHLRYFFLLADLADFMFSLCNS